MKPSRITLARRAVAFCRTMLIGALPVAALLVAQARTDMSGQVATTLLIASIAWLCVTYLTAIDPMSVARLTTTRELFGVFTSRRQD